MLRNVSEPEGASSVLSARVQSLFTNDFLIYWKGNISDQIVHSQHVCIAVCVSQII